MTNPFPGASAEPDEYRLFTLRNDSGMAVTISERGAALRSWRAPDRYGRMADVLLAEPDGPSSAFPAVRWLGRRADGGVSLLTVDGGAARLLVNYHLDDDGSLIVTCNAMADTPVPHALKLQPHFNLNGGNVDVGDHMLRIAADYYVEIDAGGVPAGVATVAGTPFDFRQPAPIGSRLRWPDTQLSLTGGFDHSFFVRNHYAGGQGALREVASVFDPGSGRRLQIYTTETALQFCAGNRAGFGLEAHARPGLMSSAWPHVILHSGQVYRQTTVYRLALQT